MVTKVNLAETFSLFREPWQPKIIGEVNDLYVKAGKFQGDFVWHHHEHEDELFLVVKGTMHMRVRENGEEKSFVVGPGEFIVIPRGVEHLPSADDEAHVVLLEPKTTLNTGNIVNERTLPELERI